jgi:hypothetical protein
MAKVICAVLRYTEDQTSLILEHEKLRQAVSYLNEFTFIFFLLFSAG